MYKFITSIRAHVKKCIDVIKSTFSPKTYITLLLMRSHDKKIYTVYVKVDHPKIYSYKLCEGQDPSALLKAAIDMCFIVDKLNMQYTIKDYTANKIEKHCISKYFKSPMLESKLFAIANSMANKNPKHLLMTTSNRVHFNLYEIYESQDKHTQYTLDSFKCIYGIKYTDLTNFEI